MKYYTTMDYFSRLYDKVGRQHPVNVSSREAFLAWKRDIRRRLASTVGLDLCEAAPVLPGITVSAAALEIPLRSAAP